MTDMQFAGWILVVSVLLGVRAMDAYMSLEALRKWVVCCRLGKLEDFQTLGPAHLVVQWGVNIDLIYNPEAEAGIFRAADLALYGGNHRKDDHAHQLSIPSELFGEFVKTFFCALEKDDGWESFFGISFFRSLQNPDFVLTKFYSAGGNVFESKPFVELIKGACAEFPESDIVKCTAVSPVIEETIGSKKWISYFEDGAVRSPVFASYTDAGGARSLLNYFIIATISNPYRFCLVRNDWNMDGSLMKLQARIKSSLVSKYLLMLFLGSSVEKAVLGVNLGRGLEKAVGFALECMDAGTFLITIFFSEHDMQKQAERENLEQVVKGYVDALDAYDLRPPAELSPMSGAPDAVMIQTKSEKNGVATAYMGGTDLNSVPRELQIILTDRVLRTKGSSVVFWPMKTDKNGSPNLSSLPSIVMQVCNFKPTMLVAFIVRPPCRVSANAVVVWHFEESHIQVARPVQCHVRGGQREWWGHFYVPTELGCAS